MGIELNNYLVLHFCSHSGSLKHWPRSVLLLIKLQFLAGEGAAKGKGTLTAEQTRRVMIKDT